MTLACVCGETCCVCVVWDCFKMLYRCNVMLEIDVSIPAKPNGL